MTIQPYSPLKIPPDFLRESKGHSLTGSLLTSNGPQTPRRKAGAGQLTLQPIAPLTRERLAQPIEELGFGLQD